MMPKTLSTPCSPRLVTVIVGSPNSELRKRARTRPLNEIAKVLHQLVKTLAIRMVQCRGDKPPPLKEIATPT